MKKYKRKSVFCELKKYDHTANDNDYIEITSWNNDEGFDIDIYSHQIDRFQMTIGQFKLLKKMVKKLEEK